MKFRETIDNFYEKIPIGIWGLIGIGGFLFVGLLICQIGATDLLGCDYKWYNHAVSELGMVISGNWSWLLFNIFLVISGILSFFFFIGLSFYFEGKYSAPVAKIGMILGFLWALMLMLIGLNPADTRRIPHYYISLIFFLLSMITPAIFSIAILVQDKRLDRQKLPRWSAIFGFIVTIIILIFLTQDPSTGASIIYLIPGVCREKIMPGVFWEWISFYSLGLWGILFSIFNLKKSTKKS
jgi:hypothetical membrane protein